MVSILTVQAVATRPASEKPLMRQFMLESVKYWIDEYHIDGFRFDLMGVHDIETMQAIREMVNRIDPSIYIYGEGWSAGSCAYPTEKLAMKANTQQLQGHRCFQLMICAMRSVVLSLMTIRVRSWLVYRSGGESEVRYRGVALLIRRWI